MRLGAKSSRLAFALSSFWLAGIAQPALGQQVVSCADPPGGQITCERNQVASCSVEKGKVAGRCQTRPSGFGAKDLQAWTLSQMLGRDVTVEQLDDPKFKSILEDGGFKDGDRTVIFSIPGEPHKQAKPQEFKDLLLNQSNKAYGSGNVLGNAVIGNNNNAIFGDNSRIDLATEPRTLTADQRREFATLVQSLPPSVKLSVLVVNDSEAQMYGQQFDDILGAANRRGEHLSVGITWSHIPVGLYFLIHSLQDPIKDSAQELLDGMRKVGILANPSTLESVPEGTIRIVVGVNPKSVKEE